LNWDTNSGGGTDRNLEAQSRKNNTEKRKRKPMVVKIFALFGIRMSIAVAGGADFSECII
jgi:hypothetical protein